MQPVAQEILNAVDKTVPFVGRSSGGGMGSATVVVELGQETLERLDRLLSSLGARSLGRRIASSQGVDSAVNVNVRRNALSGLPGEGRTSPYLDAEAAAEYLGINVKSLYGVVERRHLVPLRGPRRSYRFTREMLDEYLEATANVNGRSP